MQVLQQNVREGEEPWAWPQVPYQASSSSQGEESSARAVAAETQPGGSPIWSVGTKAALGCACFLLALLAGLCCVGRLRKQRSRKAVAASARHMILDEEIGATEDTTKSMHPRFTPAVRAHVRGPYPSWLPSEHACMCINCLLIRRSWCAAETCWARCLLSIII